MPETEQKQGKTEEKAQFCGSEFFLKMSRVWNEETRDSICKG